MTPPVGETPSQIEARLLTLVCQSSGLPPLFVIVTTWPPGFGNPCVVLKLILSGDAPMIGAVGGGGAWTVNCTITVCVLSPVSTETVPVYDPGLRPPTFTPTAVTVRVAPFN